MALLFGLRLRETRYIFWRGNLSKFKDILSKTKMMSSIWFPSFSSEIVFFNITQILSPKDSSKCIKKVRVWALWAAAVTNLSVLLRVIFFPPWARYYRHYLHCILYNLPSQNKYKTITRYLFITIINKYQYALVIFLACELVFQMFYVPNLITLAMDIIIISFLTWVAFSHKKLYKSWQFTNLYCSSHSSQTQKVNKRTQHLANAKAWHLSLQE